MAIITKYGNRYSVRVRITGNPSISKTFNDRRPAQAWAAQVEDDIRRGVYEFGKADMPTLAQALSKYAKLITPKKRGADKEAYLLAALSRLDIARKHLDQIQASELAKLRDSWLKTIRPATVQRRLAVLSHLFNTAVKEWGFDVQNPLLKVSKVKVANQRCRTVAPDELDAILASAPNHTLKAVARLGFLTAARLGELTALQWQDVNLPARVMTFPLTKNGTSRTIPLTPAAISLLEALQPKSKSNTQQRLTGPVFHTSSASMSKAWIAAVHKARRAYEKDCRDQAMQPDATWLVDAHFHDLRHSAITRLAEQGLSTLELSAISGHKSIQVLTIYTHLSAESLARKLARLEQAA